jgi:hypothetical protein
VILEQSKRLICRRRHFLKGNEEKVVWLVGWHETVGGQNRKSILYIFPDHMELGGARDDIQLIAEEES